MRRHRSILRSSFAATLLLAALASPGVRRAAAVPMEVNGDTLAFDSDRSGNGDIYLVGQDGGAAPLLDATPWPSVEARPSWEPTRTDAFCAGNGALGDPERIAFQSDAGTPGDLDIQTVSPDLAMNAAESRAPVDVTADPAADDTAPAWSPILGSPVRSDIAYERAPAGQPGAKRDIWIVDPSTGNRVDFTNDPAHDEANPEWSPVFDRSFLAYDSDRSGTRQIWIQEYTVGVGANLPTPRRDPIQITRGPAPAADPTWVAHSALSNEDPVQLAHELIYRTDELGTSFLDDLVHDFATVDDNALPLPYDGTDGTVWPLTGDPGGDASPA